MNTDLDPRLTRFAQALVDQKAARVAVEPNRRAPGFWFGGGNCVIGPDGALYTSGRYRNAGDSRTGVKAGARGLELAVFRTEDDVFGGGTPTFEKVLSLTKDQLSASGREVLSIEGTALRVTAEGVELFISTEKGDLPYPPGLEEFQKPGTGVWSIDVARADSFERLASAPLEPVVMGTDPQYWHVKDPVVHETSDGGVVLFFCTHPFTWTSSNSAYMVLKRSRGGSQRFKTPTYDFFPRGFTWDVAVSRITDVLCLDTGRSGLGEPVTLVFYDGAECMRDHEQNAAAVSRPRGYSCEEISGLAAYRGDDPGTIRRISKTGPLFTSPWGSGTSRYTHTLATDTGIIASWQQGQSDGSQPLVINALTWEEVRRHLSSD